MVLMLKQPECCKPQVRGQNTCYCSTSTQHSVWKDQLFSSVTNIVSHTEWQLPKMSIKSVFYSLARESFWLMDSPLKDKYMCVYVWAFSVFGPSTWNDLPLPLWQKLSLDSFKCNLKNLSFPKTVDLPYFQFHAAVFIHLKSLFATCFKLCIFSFVQSECLCVCGCLCVCVCVCVCLHVCA